MHKVSNAILTETEFNQTAAKVEAVAAAEVATARRLSGRTPATCPAASSRAQTTRSVFKFTSLDRLVYLDLRSVQ